MAVDLTSGRDVNLRLARVQSILSREVTRQKRQPELALSAEHLLQAIQDALLDRSDAATLMTQCAVCKCPIKLIAADANPGATTYCTPCYDRKTAVH